MGEEEGHTLEVAREPARETRSQIIHKLKSSSNLGTAGQYNFGKLLLWHAGELRISGKKELREVTC